MSDSLVHRPGPSLRLRIFLGTSVALTLVVFIGSLAVWLAARAILERGLNDDLRERAHAFSARFAPRGPPHPLSNGRPSAPERRSEGRNDPRVDERKPPPNQANAPPELRQGDGTLFMQIIDEEKNEISRSPSLPDNDSLAALLPSQFNGDRIALIHLHDGRPIRVMAERLPPGPLSLPTWLSTAPTTASTSGTLTMIIGIDAAPVTNDLERLALALAALWIVTSALGIGVAVWLQRTVLVPVARISHDIGGLGPDELHARLSTIHVPREMQIIPQRLNDLLGRLEAAFLREKATIANIAHELRTPVAGLRMTLELSLAAKPSVTEHKTLTTCLRITLSMQAMIANLLTLARLEAHPLSPTTDETDVEEITRACWSTLDARASERGLHIHWEMNANVALVRAAPEPVHMIVSNLLDNAVSYCPPTENITVTSENRGTHVALTVRNPTDGTLKKCTDIFLPFWRGDTSRTGDLHCGLGLALVQRLVSALGGSVQAQLDDQHHFIITVLLPAVMDEPAKHP